MSVDKSNERRIKQSRDSVHSNKLSRDSLLSKSKNSLLSSKESKQYIKLQFDEKMVQVPRVLDKRFVLQDILDRGGFGSIINAYDKKNLQGVPAVVKIVSLTKVDDCR